MKTIIVIPARFESSRFPGKPLASVGGTPMIVRVWEQACKAMAADKVLVATDDNRIADVVRQAGGIAVLTDPNLPSGTDRVFAALDGCLEDIVVNLQGDEPLINPQHIDIAVQALIDAPHAQVSTLSAPVSSQEELWDPNTVKVLVDQNDTAIYFSRTPIPSPPDQPVVDLSKYRRHVGLYVYRRTFLEEFVSTAPVWSEQIERLEQLRVLHLGKKIVVKTVTQVFPGIDTPQDLETVEKILNDQDTFPFKQE